MRFKILSHEFEGPFPSPAFIRRDPGVYFVLCHWEGSYVPLDCGAADDLKTAIEENPRKSCWAANCQGAMKYAVRYLPDSTSSERASLAQELRKVFPLPCG